MITRIAGIIIISLCITVPLHAMSVRGSRLIPKTPSKPVRSKPIRYQSTEPTIQQEFIKEQALINKQNRMLSKEEIKTEDNRKKKSPKFISTRQYAHSGWSKVLLPQQ